MVLVYRVVIVLGKATACPHGTCQVRSEAVVHSDIPIVRTGISVTAHHVAAVLIFPDRLVSGVICFPELKTNDSRRLRLEEVAPIEVYRVVQHVQQSGIAVAGKGAAGRRVPIIRI